MSVAAALASPTGLSLTQFAIANLTAVALAAAASPLAVPFAIGGSVFAAQAVYYYWSDENNKALQAKAKERYCTLNPNDPVCSSAASIAGQYILEVSDSFYGIDTIYGIDTNAGEWIPPFSITADGLEFVDGRGVRFAKHYQENVRYIKIHNYCLASQKPPGGKCPTRASNEWKDLTQAQREAMIRNLSDEDWNDVLKQMPQGGTIADGQTLNSPAILLGNGKVVPSESRALSSEAASIVNALQPDLDALRQRLDSLPTDLANPGIGTIGASIAALAGVGLATRANTDAIKNSITAMQSSIDNGFNAMKKRFKQIAGFMNFDRILNILIWWQTLHNAFMLSADLSRSLVSAFSTVLKALPGDSLLGMPTESADGSPIDLATQINKSVEAWIKGAIGAENYKVMKLELAQINRIYQSTANIWSNTVSAFDSFRSVTTLGVERISIVANALRKNGLVRDDAYKAMSEKVNVRSASLARIDRAVEGLEALNDATSAVESVASDVVSIQEEVTEIKKYRKEYEDEKTKLIKEIEKKESDSKKDSKTPDFKEEDEQRHAT